MTALMALTTRLKLARLALVVPPEIPGAEAAAFAAHGADLLVLSSSPGGVEDSVEAVAAARERIYPLPTLIAVDDPDVAVRCAADVVFVRRPRWRPLGYRRPHPWSLFGRSIDGAGDVARLDGDPFVFGFLGPAVDASGINPQVAALAARSGPLDVPAGPVWFAAGGISCATVGDVLSAGARRVVVSNAVFHAPDPFAETRAIADAVDAAWRADPLADAYATAAFDG